MVKTLFASLALFALAAGASLAQPMTANAQAQAPKAQAYSLYCRGGGSSFMNVEVGGSLQLQAELGIKHGAAKYDPDTLKAGHCAWVDRPIASAEPYHLFLARTFSKRYLRVTRIGSTTRLVLRDGTGKAKDHPEVNALNAMGHDNNVVEFRVVTKEFDRVSTNGTTYKRKFFVIESVGVIHQLQDLQQG